MRAQGEERKRVSLCFVSEVISSFCLGAPTATLGPDRGCIFSMSHANTCTHTHTHTHTRTHTHTHTQLQHLRSLPVLYFGRCSKETSCNMYPQQQTAWGVDREEK